MTFKKGDIVSITADCIGSGQVSPLLATANVLEVREIKEWEVFPIVCFCESLLMYEHFKGDELILVKEFVLNKEDFL